MAGGFTLRLAPEFALGRRFQLALLSFAPVDVVVEGDEAVLRDPGDYVAAVEAAARHVLERLRLGARRRNCRAGKLELKVLGEVDCCLYPPAPRLYTAGVSDYKLLQAALGVDSWVCAALRYADEVASRGAPLGGSARDLPWLAKASVFTSVRGPGGGVGKSRAQGYTLDTLGSVLLGGAAGFLGSYRLGDSQAEFYLLPEAPSDAYRGLLDYLSLGGPGESPSGNLAGLAVWLARRAPVSLDAAVGAALAAKLGEALGEAGALGYASQRIGVAKLYLVRSGGKRPMVTEGVPLTTAHLELLGGDAVRALVALAREASVAGEEGSGALAAVATCVNAALLDAANPCLSGGLQACLRDLDSLAKAPGLARRRPQLVKAAWWAARAVQGRVAKILEGCLAP